MTKISRSFIIRFYNDEHGLKGAHSSIQEAVDYINKYFGKSGKGVRWIIVCEDRTRITKGATFIREEITRYTVAHVRYSEHADAFVSEEVLLQSVD